MRATVTNSRCGEGAGGRRLASLFLKASDRSPPIADVRRNGHHRELRWTDVGRVRFPPVAPIPQLLQTYRNSGRLNDRVHPSRSLRWATADDSDVLADIMFDAVRNGESRYTEMQRAAWVPARRSGPEWVERLRRQDIVLAEEDGRAIGFASLAQGGYVDFAYIRPEAQHTGLFRQLLTQIVKRAIEKGEPRLWTHASLTAEPAFAKLGFTIRKRERVRIGDQDFDRCEMEKSLVTG